MAEILINGLEDITNAAETFLKEIGDNKIVAFYGNLGAGKTTFISAICSVLGVEDIVCSPTFTIVNEYCAASGEPIFHFDFYRINNPSEAFDIGIEEYFYDGGLCLIEWPEKIEELLPDNVLRVTIETVNQTNRILRF